MRLKRLGFRMLYYPVVFVIKFFLFFSQAFYMRCFCGFLKLCGLKIHGRPRYISDRVYFDDLSLITLGHNCVVSRDVVFLTHDYAFNMALAAKCMCQEREVCIDGKIELGENVFVGLRSTILPNTRIGDNVIIGACSLVKGEIPSNVVVGGVPARVLMTIDEYLTKNQIPIL